MAIDFNQANNGGYLDVTTNNTDGNGLGIALIDQSGGGIDIDSTSGPLTINTGSNVQTLQSAGGFIIQDTSPSTEGINIAENAGGGVNISNAGDGGITILDGGTTASTLTVSGQGPGGLVLDSITSINAHKPVAMNSHKITGLANGTVSTDAAAFGQIPTALPPNGSAGGDLTGTYPNPTLAAGVGGKLLYDFTITGSSQAAIDTDVDGTAALLSGSYTELVVLMAVQTVDAAVVANAKLTLNNDTGANYDFESIRGNNATAAASSSLAQTSWQFQTHGSTGTSGYPGVAVLTIPFYAGTTWNKIGTLTTGTMDATAADNQSNSIVVGWRSTAAVNRIKIAGATANLAVGSRLAVFAR